MSVSTTPRRTFVTQEEEEEIPAILKTTILDAHPRNTTTGTLATIAEDMEAKVALEVTEEAEEITLIIATPDLATIPETTPQKGRMDPEVLLLKTDARDTWAVVIPTREQCAP